MRCNKSLYRGQISGTRLLLILMFYVITSYDYVMSLETSSSQTSLSFVLVTFQFPHCTKTHRYNLFTMADTGMRGTNALQDSVRLSSSPSLHPLILDLKRGSKIKNLPASNPPNSLNISLKKLISAKSTSPSSVPGLLKRLPSLSKWRMILLWSMSLGCLKIVTILYVSNTHSFCPLSVTNFADDGFVGGGSRLPIRRRCKFPS